jgi:hypothetical protein
MKSTVRRAILAALAVPVLVVAAVFVYGYWHTRSHAVVAVEVSDSSGAIVPPADSSLTFLDENGRALAQYAGDEWMVFYVSSPQYACRALEKRAPFERGGHEAYRACFYRQARWIATWASDMRLADLTIGACRWRRVAVAVFREPTGPSDWWLFWPSPHMGGTPITRYRAGVRIDPASCPSAPSNPSTPPTANREPPTANRQPRTANRQPPTANR